VNGEIACTVICNGDPRTLDDAVLQVSNISTREDSVQRLARSRHLRAEPMEVGVVGVSSRGSVKGEDRDGVSGGSG